jgi:Flp pilus assembly pilin Flp
MSLCLLWLAHQYRQFADRRRAESGQATVEYALVVLAAATIALLVLAWASRTGKVGQLLDAVFDQVSGRLG